MSYFKLSPNQLAVKIYRISNFFSKKKINSLAIFFQRLNLCLNGVEIHPEAKIGKNLMLVHTAGIVIGKNVVMGNDVRIYSSVVLGVKNAGTGIQPTVGNNVILSTGAKILGGVHIGDNSVVGANAVVLTDVPEGFIAIGVPSKNYKKNDIYF